MRTFLWFTVIAAGLILFGCDSSEKPAAQKTEAQKAPAVQTPVKAEKAMESEEAKVATSAVELAQEAADKMEEKTEQTAKMAEEIEGEVAKEVSSVTDEAGKAGEQAVKVSGEAATKVEEQAAAVVAETKQATADPVKAVQEAVSPQEIILEASKGNITFTHGMHADTYDCSLCHGDGTPAAFDLTKEVAHKLCKDCHKEEGAGPTSCRACHVK